MIKILHHKNEQIPLAFLAAQELMKENYFVTLIETDEMLRYKNGVYHSGAEAFIKAKTQENVSECDVNKRLCEEVIGHIQRSTYRSRSEFDIEPYILNLKNGLLDIRTREFKTHTPDYLSRIQLPINYDPKARCRKIAKFLRQIMPDQRERKLLIEEAAVTLVRNARQQKAFMYVGDGANGKTTFLMILSVLLGKENISNIPLQKLAANRFAAAELESKLANIYSDISDLEMKETGIIKSIISGDPINVERKNKPSYTLMPYAKLFYCANKLPEVNNDQSFAFFRRWIIHEFTQKFDGNKRKKHIIDQLTTDIQLSGFLNKLIPLACKFTNGHDFSEAPTTEQVREMWGEKANIIKSFASECLKIDSESHIERNRLYNEYVRWCKKKNYSPKSKVALYEKLEKDIGLETTVIRIGKKTPRVMKGASLRYDTVSNVSEFQGTLSSPTCTDRSQEIEPETLKQSETFNTNNKRKFYRKPRTILPIPEHLKKMHDEGLEMTGVFFAQIDYIGGTSV